MNWLDADRLKVVLLSRNQFLAHSTQYARKLSRITKRQLHAVDVQSVITFNVHVQTNEFTWQRHLDRAQQVTDDDFELYIDSLSVHRVDETQAVLTQKQFSGSVYTDLMQNMQTVGRWWLPSSWDRSWADTRSLPIHSITYTVRDVGYLQANGAPSTIRSEMTHTQALTRTQKTSKEWMRHVLLLVGDGGHYDSMTIGDD